METTRKVTQFLIVVLTAGMCLGCAVINNRVKDRSLPSSHQPTLSRPLLFQPCIRRWAPIAPRSQWVPAWSWLSHGQAGGLAARSVNILFQVCFPFSRLHAGVPAPLVHATGAT